MNLIRLFLGRRQFLFTFISSILAMVTGRSTRAAEKPAAAGKKALRGMVLYYSGTGNTAQVADAIYKGMKSVIACDVAPIDKLKAADMGKYDVIAIGAPNWYMRVPANILSFIMDMPVMAGKHAVIFGTHGSGGPGMFWNLSRNILRRGFTVIGWSDWYGSDFMTPHSSVPDGEWGHPDYVDLCEAEAFGKMMAEYSIRIYAGETGLLPDGVPAPDMGGGSLFSANSTGSYKIGFAGGAANAAPKFDLSKCVYPRCTQCISNCPVGAIDLSVIAAAGSIIDKNSKSDPVILKEACQRCGGLCERVCYYGAIAYVGTKGVRVFQSIDKTKCTYPKCTECMDLCPQDSIDVTKTPAVVQNWCENESLCWGVCPVDAISFTPTSMHIDEGAGDRTLGQGPGGGGQGGRGGMGQASIAGGPGGGAGMGQMPMDQGIGSAAGGPPGGMMESYSPRFRNLLKEEVKAVGVADLKLYPRVPVNKKLWPYNVEKG
jgi:flavodoxin/ferredoxin